MGALLSIVMLPFIWLAGVLFAGPAQEAPPKETSVTQAAFVMPPKDNPYYEDLPWVTPWEWTKLPKIDFNKAMEAYKAEPKENQSFGKFMQKIGDQIVERDFQIVLSTWPRVALVFDYETGEFRGITDEGVFHLGFSYNKNLEHFYATRNPWMRVMGFMPFYEKLGDDLLGMFQLHSKVVDFAYNGLDYRVQIWKGQYFFKTVVGSEVGFYTKPQSRGGEHYDCLPLEDMLPISIKLYNNIITYYDLPPEEHWWAVMMTPNGPKVPPHQLSLDSSIDFSGDPALGRAFFAAIQAQHPDLAATKEGNVVRFSWSATEQLPEDLQW